MGPPCFRRSLLASPKLLLAASYDGPLQGVVVFVPPWTCSCPALHGNISSTPHSTKGSACHALLVAGVIVASPCVRSCFTFTSRHSPQVSPRLPPPRCQRPPLDTIAIHRRCHTHHHTTPQCTGLAPRVPLPVMPPLPRVVQGLPSLPPHGLPGHVAKCPMHRPNHTLPS